MVRVKRAANAAEKRRATLECASGYRGQCFRLYRKVKEQITYSFVYNYRDRKARKRESRKLRVTRTNAVARTEGLTYNRFVQSLTLAGIEVDRRQLVGVAANDPKVLATVVVAAEKALPENVNASKQA